MSEQNIQLIQKLVQAVNNNDFGTVESIYAPNVSYHSSGDLANADRNAMVRDLKEYRNAFSELTITMEDVFASGDKVAYRITWSGTHTGELFGVRPTNKRVTARAVNMSRISGGKIVEEWSYGDDIDLWQQLGVAPPAAVTAKR